MCQKKEPKIAPSNQIPSASWVGLVVRRFGGGFPHSSSGAETPKPKRKQANKHMGVLEMKWGPETKWLVLGWFPFEPANREFSYAETPNNHKHWKIGLVSCRFPCGALLVSASPQTQERERPAWTKARMLAPGRCTW